MILASFGQESLRTDFQHNFREPYILLVQCAHVYSPDKALIFFNEVLWATSLLLSCDMPIFYIIQFFFCHVVWFFHIVQHIHIDKVKEDASKNMQSLTITCVFDISSTWIQY
ncbi:hypothetical protein ACJX0J_040551, partial [Zea mays]